MSSSTIGYMHRMLMTENAFADWYSLVEGL